MKILVILSAVLALAVAIPVDAEVECETSAETSRAVSLEDKAADSGESKPAVPVKPQHSEPVNPRSSEMTGTKPSDKSIQVTVPGNNPLTSLPWTSADIVSLCSKLSYNFPGSTVRMYPPFTPLPAFPLPRETDAVVRYCLPIQTSRVNFPVSSMTGTPFASVLRPESFFNSLNTDQAAVLQNWPTSYAGVPQQLPLDEVYKVITFGKPGMTAAAVTETPGVIEGGPTAVPATWSPEAITFGGVPVRLPAQGPAAALSLYPDTFSFAGVPVKIASSSTLKDVTNFGQIPLPVMSAGRN